jgi:hypothetical protein
MKNAAHEELNVDKIMARIRQEVARRKGMIQHGPFTHRDAQNRHIGTEWMNIAALISGAERHANIGDRPLHMTQFRTPIRWLARAAGRIVLYFTQIITNTQGHFNRSITQILRAVVRSAEVMNRGAVEREARLAGLASSVAEQDNRLENFERRMADLARELVEQVRHVGDLEKRLLEAVDGLSNLARGLGEESNAFRDVQRIIVNLKTAVSELAVGQVSQERRLNLLLEEGRTPSPKPFGGDGSRRPGSFG